MMRRFPIFPSVALGLNPSVARRNKSQDGSGDGTTKKKKNDDREERGPLTQHFASQDVDVSRLRHPYWSLSNKALQFDPYSTDVSLDDEGEFLFNDEGMFSESIQHVPAADRPLLDAEKLKKLRKE